MRDKETGLTPKQLAFAKAYALEPNATKAYKAAGYYSKSYSHIHGYKLLQNKTILAIIAKEKLKTAIVCELKREEVIADIKYGASKAKERNNLSALARFTELECRVLGMLTDNINTTDIVAQQQLESTESAEVIEIAKVRVKQFVNRPAKEA